MAKVLCRAISRIRYNFSTFIVNSLVFNMSVQGIIVEIRHLINVLFIGFISKCVCYTDANLFCNNPKNYTRVINNSSQLIIKSTSRSVRCTGIYIDTFYQVSLQIRSSNFHFCGGSIYNEYYIITAGHCAM